MNKQQLGQKIGEKLNQLSLTEADKSAIVDAFTESVKEALVAGDDISLVGFGTFKVGHRAARTGRNPKTGEEIQIAEAKVASFKAGKGLKDALNP